jgi:alkaline phosphatase
VRKIVIPLVVVPLFSLSISSAGDSGRCQPDLKSAKNLILVIADGMGPQAMGLAFTYARYAPESVIEERTLNLERLLADAATETGLMLTLPGRQLEAGRWHGYLVTDSAAGGTQLATGKPSFPEMIGIDTDGRRVESVLEKAGNAGLVTGLVSDSRITHATPAAFAAHQISRDDEDKIAEDLLAAGPDVMLAGGLQYFLPMSVSDGSAPDYEQLRALIPPTFKNLYSGRWDERNLIFEAMCKQMSASCEPYNVVFDLQGLRRSQGRTLGLFAMSKMDDAIAVHSRDKEARQRAPSLAEMTEKALGLLEGLAGAGKDGQQRGIFLMVEAGSIDSASHENDAGRLLHEMLAFDEALGVVLAWAGAHDDTLVVVTSDHETGGFGFAYAHDRLPDAVDLDGREDQYQAQWNYQDPEILDRIYAQRHCFSDIRKKLEKKILLEQLETTPETWIQARLESLYQEELETLLSKTEAEHGNALDAAAQKALEKRYQKILELRARDQLHSELGKAYAWEWEKERRRRLALELQGLFEASVGLEIDLAQAEAIVTREPFKYRKLGHPSLDFIDYPPIRDFSEFHGGRDYARDALMGRAVARQQGVAWASGAHSSTPVMVMALGARHHTQCFNGLHTSTSVGRLLQRALGLP